MGNTVEKSAMFLEIEKTKKELKTGGRGDRNLEFPGSVSDDHGAKTIVSFPGVYEAEWLVLTELHRTLSSSCVFFPKGHKLSGKHALADGSDKCWCYQIYGEEKPWGCAWFQKWKENTEQAVANGHHLLVVYKHNERGQGKIDWEECTEPRTTKRPGLGVSQAAEVAFCDKMGWQYDDLDVERVIDAANGNDAFSIF